MTSPRRRQEKWANQPTFDPDAVVHYVYECLDPAGRLLYIGRSKDVNARVRNHQLGPWGADLASVRTHGPMAWREVLDAERAMIVAAKPPHNREFIVHNVPRVEVPVDLP